MGKFIKEFIMEIELFKLKSKYSNKLYKYGLIGEERVAYQLKTCDEDILCLYDVILEVNNQMSTNILAAVNGASGVASDNMIYC